MQSELLSYLRTKAARSGLLKLQEHGLVGQGLAPNGRTFDDLEVLLQLEALRKKLNSYEVEFYETVADVLPNLCPPSVVTEKSKEEDQEPNIWLNQ